MSIKMFFPSLLLLSLLLFLQTLYFLHPDCDLQSRLELYTGAPSPSIAKLTDTDERDTWLGR